MKNSNQEEIVCFIKRLRKQGNDGFYLMIALPNRYDKNCWVDTSDRDGEWLFSFDKKTIFNMFADYPYKLTKEQKKIFDEENPYWMNFFSDRQ